ncbi:MAG: response regulator, partial [Thermoproteota archaeon]
MSQIFSSQITAIIIDDDKGITTVFREYLQIHGIATLGVGHDGKSVVELYQKTKPDIVFLDVIM